MTDPRKPEGGPDALDEAYRRASAADPSRPSEQARAAILANARAVATAARQQAQPKIDPRRAAANDPFWWRSAAASVAIALVGLMIWAPHFESASVESNADTASRQETVASAPQLPPPPAAKASEPVRAGAEEEPRLEQPAAARMRSSLPRPPATEAPPPRESVGALAAAAPQPAPLVLEPGSGANASAGAPARAQAPAAGALSADAPQADKRAAAPSAAPPASARKPELEEIVVTGGRAHAGTSSPSPVAQSESYSRGSLAARAIDSAERGAGLDAAIARGDAERVRELIAPKGALEARDARGRTPLMRAVVAGQAAVVRALLDAGADPNAADAEGATPRARATNRADIAALLEERGGH